jgi:acid stress-induced BolA-like protein IbaG/YrbA
VDPLIQKLTILLSERFPGSAPEIHPSRGNGRVWGILVWPQFDGQEHLARQDRVWEVLKESLAPEELPRVSAILAMTPMEMADE